MLRPQLAELERSACRSVGEANVQAALLAAGLVSHARLEEELLFGPLQRYLDPQSGPLAVMKLEHEQIEALLEQIQSVEDAEQARSLATRLHAIAREHFAKEEQILFPMAENLVGEDELLRLGAEWARHRLPA